MYAVSESFKNAIKNPFRKSTIYGTLTTTAGVEYPLNDSTFIKDSFYITNQCVNDNKLCFGSVYAGECGFIINSPIDRYSLFGAGIALNLSIGEKCKNLLSYPYADTTKTVQGLTYTDNGDGTLTVTGTPTGTAAFNLGNFYGNGVFTFSGLNGVMSSIVDFYNTNGVRVARFEPYNDFTFNTADYEDYAYVNIGLKRRYIQEHNYVVRPQIEAGTKATEYEAYREEIEPIPLGKFYVDTAERIGSKIKITSIDAMSNFDIPIDEDITGAWYELVSYIAKKCGVELAQTQAEIEVLHINATNQTYTIMQEHLSTYRDALALLSMVICANATIDRNGKLKFVQFATDACDSNDRASRLNGAKFSDYTTRYAGITARFFKDQNYATYSAVDENINGLILDCGDIPIVGGTVDGKHATINAMLETLKQIVYVPATLYIASNPAYDLGDKIECTGINNTADSVYTYIMQYKFEYRKKETINCYGENPLLQNIKDQAQKLAASFENAISAKDMVLVNYTNASDYHIEQSFKEIIMLSYTFQQDCRPIILCTIPFRLDTDGYVEFKLYNGLIELEDATYKGYYPKGEHFASFMYLDNCQKGARQRIRVLAKCYADTTSDIRVQDARIKTLENSFKLIQSKAEDITVEDASVDTTEPTAFIKIGTIQAIAYTNAGNGGVLTWDGVIELIDEFAPILTNAPQIASFTADISTEAGEPASAGLIEVFTDISVSNVRFDGIGITTWRDMSNVTWGEAISQKWGEL